MTDTTAEYRQLPLALVANMVGHLARHAPGAAVEDTHGALAVAGARPLLAPALNGLVRTDSRADPAAILERARAFFGRLGREFILWTSDATDADLEQAALAGGFEQRLPLDGHPVMVLSRAPASPEVPPGVELAVVSDLAAAESFVDVVAASYESLGQPAEVTRAIFAGPRALFAPGAVAFLATVDGVPAACALTVVRGPLTGLYWVGTIEAARRRGLGELVTRAALRAGFERGATVAALWSSPPAYQIYRRLGFVETGRYRRYASRYLGG